MQNTCDIPKQSLLEMGTPNSFKRRFSGFQPVGCPECREGYKGRVGIWGNEAHLRNFQRLYECNALEIAASESGVNNHVVRF